MPETTPVPPRKVVLFSGHMIDAPGREKPRFPPDKEPVAAQSIANALADLHVGPDDLCICGGACGGDLLFAEAALARSALLEIYIPLEEPTFIEKSVDFANKDWRAQFFDAKARSALHVAPRELGPLQEGENPYERENRWMLDFSSALRRGQGRFRLSLEWRGRRRTGRRAAHDGRGSQQGGTHGVARHHEAVGLIRPGLLVRSPSPLFVRSQVRRAEVALCFMTPPPRACRRRSGLNT